MIQTPKLWFSVGTAALFLACGGHASNATQSATNAMASLDGSTHPAAEATEHTSTNDAPPPPISHPEPRGAGETRLTHPSGASLCMQERPELAGVLLLVDATSYTAPEQRVLLRAWLARTLAPSSPGIDAEPPLQIPPGCDDHLFCSVFPQDKAEEAVDRLADFLNTPQLQTFFAARDAATEQVDELYQRSAAFRLHALAENLFAGRINSVNAAQSKVLDSSLGANAVGTMLPAVVHQALLTQLQSIQVSILAPRAALSLGHRLMERLHPKPTVSRQNTIAYASTAPIRIRDERYPEAQLLMTWPTLTPGNAREAHAALVQLAGKIYTRHPAALVLPPLGDSITPRPALRVVASWNELGELAPELDDWATQLGRAPFSASLPGPPAASCAPQTILGIASPGNASPGNASPDAARAWGRPQVIIWGAEHAQPSEEQF